MELSDEIRGMVEALKTFDVSHELRMIVEEHNLGCPGASNTEEMLAEKFKSFHGDLVSTVEKLFGLVIHLQAELNTHKENSYTDQPIPLLLSEEDRLRMVSQTEPEDDYSLPERKPMIYDYVRGDSRFGDE